MVENIFSFTLLVTLLLVFGGVLFVAHHDGKFQGRVMIGYAVFGLVAPPLVILWLAFLVVCLLFGFPSL